MTRIILELLLPLVLPTAIYLVWAWLAKHAGKHDRTVAARLQEGPWFWLVLLGLLSMGIVLIASALLGGHDPSGTYAAPRWEGGRIIPGHVD